MNLIAMINLIHRAHPNMFYHLPLSFFFLFLDFFIYLLIYIFL